MRDYEAACTHASVQRLRIPVDEAYEREARALVSLARLAVERGRARDLNALHAAMFGLDEQGGEILEGGILRLDAIQLAWDWNAHKDQRRIPSGWMLRDRLTSATDLMMGHLVYETAVRDGLVWLAALARAAQGRPARFSKSSATVSTGGQLWLPHFKKAVEAFRDELVALGRHRLLSAQDRQALRNWMDALKRAGLDQRSNQEALRDGVAHGRLSFSHDGTVVLDAYEHLVLSRGAGRSSRRADRVHPYKYRTITAENCEKFLDNACGQAALVWGAVEEFRKGFINNEPAERATERPARKDVQAVRRRMAPLRTSARKKARAIERMQQKRRRGLKGIKVKVEFSRPEGAPR